MSDPIVQYVAINSRLAARTALRWPLTTRPDTDSNTSGYQACIDSRVGATGNEAAGSAAWLDPLGVTTTSTGVAPAIVKDPARQTKRILHDQADDTARPVAGTP